MSAFGAEYREKAVRLTAWTKRKLRIHMDARTFYFAERELWWSSLGENIGDEVNGKHDVFERPVIVLKKLSRNLFFAVPVTTQPKQGSWFYRFGFRGENRWAVLVQARVMSSKRLVRRMGNIDHATLVDIHRSLTNLIQTDPPADQG